MTLEQATYKSVAKKLFNIWRQKYSYISDVLFTLDKETNTTTDKQ